MDAKLINILRTAGDRFAQEHMTIGLDEYRILDPYFPDDDGGSFKRTDWTTANGVDALLTLVESSSNPEVREVIRKALDYRVDRYDEGDAYINGLNFELWSRMAHLVLIRALEMMHRRLHNRPEIQWLTAREVESRYRLAPGSARRAVQRGYVTAEKRGHDLLFDPATVEQYWGHRLNNEPPG